MKNILVIGAGGFLGAIARYGVAMLVATFWAREFPLGTFLINVTGSFVLGFFAVVAAARADLDPAWRLFVAVGFLGAYTTFSTFEYETHRLVVMGSTLWAIANVVASVLVGYGAVRLGEALAQ
jgi:fluoride exporter